MSFRIVIVVLLVAMPGVLAIAQSRRDGSGVAPPPVVSRTIQARRGEEVVVPLGIHGARGGQLDFLIRNPPAYGRLSRVTRTALNAATVTYSAPTKPGLIEDRFTYAVRSSEGVSAPGLVTIRFIEAPAQAPKLRVPGEQDFPSVFPGQTSTVEMDLVNEGGGVIEGEVTVSEPWTVEGIKYFRLAGGQRTTVRILFKSDKPGVLTGSAFISGTERKTIPLRATVEERLSANPPQLKLTARPGSQTRTGSILISNRSDEAAAVVVAAGARLLTERVVNVPARGTATLPVFADASEGGAFDEEVKLSSDHWATTVAVHAVAVGAILKFVGDELRIVGTAGGISASGTATIENVGAEDVTVRLDIDPPFELERPVVVVPGRGRLEIPVRAPKADPGSYRAILRTAGAGSPVMVTVTAELSPRAALTSPVVAKPGQETVASEQAPDAAAPEDPEMPWMPRTLSELPNALGKFARQIGTDAAVLEWPASLGPSAGVRLEQRVISLSGGDTLQVDWVPLQNARITAGVELVKAELRDLDPRTLHTIRAVAGDGAEAAPLFTVEFWTLPKQPLFNFGWRVPALVLALAALAFSIWRSRRMPRK